MGVFETAQGILLAFWVPLLALVSLILGYMTFQKRTEQLLAQRKEERLWRRETAQTYSSIDHMKDNNREIADLLKAYLETSFSQLGQRLGSAVSDNVMFRLNPIMKLSEDLPRMVLGQSDSPLDVAAIEKSLKETVRNEIAREFAQKYPIDHSADLGPGKPSVTTPETLIRELSHALNTPLSRIEVITEAHLPITKEIYQHAPELASSLQQIRSSVEICKAYLAAFRQMVLLTSQSLLWSPTSLRSVVQAAFQVFCKENEGKTLKVDLPDHIPGQNNNLVFAILLPLLENSIEASPTDSEIEVSSSLAGPLFSIAVINKAIYPPDAKKMFERGFTTKEGHDGLGLSIAQSLIATIPGGTLNANTFDDRVVLTVSIPTEIVDAP